jgi:hypothetical protein
MKDFIVKNRVSLIYFIIGITAICVLMTFILPYLADSLMNNTSVNILSLVVSILLAAAGIVLFILALLTAGNKEIIREKKVPAFLGSLLLAILAVLVLIIIISFITALLSKSIFLFSGLAYDKAKFLTDIVTKVINICVQPLLLWFLAGVIYQKSFTNGFKKALNTLKKGYLKLLAVIFITTVITFLASFMGNQIAELIIKAVISVVVSTVVITAALYLFKNAGKEATAHE